jgi:mono/diheme cytochrome c family protein
MRVTSLLTASILAFPALATGNADGPALDHFEKKVRPLLAEHCIRCHGPEKQKGGLRLDSGHELAKGGETGATLAAGKPDESLLIEAVRYATDLKMPPKGKLAEAEIAALVEWVRAGAPWPESGPPTPAPVASASGSLFSPEQKAFWAFQPMKEPASPSVKEAAWARSPIDRFILSGLEANQLKPAPPADRRALIRRATFDLTGLPPIPGEVAAFLADESPDAFAKVVDRLLASPRYGERWARFWLDLARYADSNGMDENVAYAQAWRYRDYVVAAFNKDKPYDQFVKEQLAGDLLPAPSEAVGHEQVTATGFLTLGPKMLAEDDPMKMEMDIIDEQVDTVGKAFLGLTLGCARCHDHKFDPLPTADYYSLAGIFKSTKSMQHYNVVAMWNERALATPEQKAALDEHRKQVAALEGQIKGASKTAREALKSQARSRLADYLLATASGVKLVPTARALLADPKGFETPGLQVVEAESFARGNVGIDRDNHGVGIGVILNVGPMPNFAEYDFEVPKAGLYQVELRYASIETRPVVASLNGEPLGAEVAGQPTGSWGPDSQTWTVAGVAMLPAGKATLRLARESGPIPHFDKVALIPRPLPDGAMPTPDELARLQGLNPKLRERWAATLEKAKADPNSIFRPWIDPKADAPEVDPARAIRAKVDRDPKPTTPVERASRYRDLFDEAEKADGATLSADPVLAAFRKVLDDPQGPVSPGRKVEELFLADTRAGLDALREQVKTLNAKAPPVNEAMGVEDKKAVDLKVHIRGSHLTLGEVAPRRFPRIVAGEAQPSIGEDRSGRKELAEWLTRPDHPLTARVMANRLWLWHFGQGIVGSPDNFGRLGERPTHPELLDWLALRFVESGWSIKAMHRTIMLSSTYQMGASYDPAAALADPDNRLRWRFDRRRLEAEAIRDAMLAVSGELDPAMGGTRLTTKSHDYVNSTGSAQKTALYEVNLRSIYLPVIRSGLYSVFQAFDFADPSTSNGQRVPTTVAPQALFMMNDSLALRTSAAWAKKVLARADLDDAGRVALAYETAYGRPPRPEETTRALDYLSRFDDLLTSKGVKDADRPVQAWQALTQAIFSASEFISID